MTNLKLIQKIANDVKSAIEQGGNDTIGDVMGDIYAHLTESKEARKDYNFLTVSILDKIGNSVKVSVK